MKTINTEHIRNIILSYMQLLTGFALCFIIFSVINKYYPNVLLTFLLEAIKTFLIPIFAVVIVKLQLDINYSNLELNQKKFIFEQKDKIEQFKKSIIKDIDSILKYKSYQERIFNEIAVDINEKTETQLEDLISNFQNNIKKHQDIMTYYYEVIDNTVSINLLSSIKENIIKADKYFSNLKLDSEKHIKFIKEQIEFQDQNNFKYKKEIIELYQKEINEIPHWDDFKKLLLEIKNQINQLD